METELAQARAQAETTRAGLEDELAKLQANAEARTRALEEDLAKARAKAEADLAIAQQDRRRKLLWPQDELLQQTLGVKRCFQSVTYKIMT